MAFQATTSGVEALKAVVSSVATLVEEATFEATGEGISFKGMDPSHVALIDISWPNSAFASYTCDKEIKFGVRIDELAKLVRRAAKTDDIKISITEDNKLSLGMGSRHYKMRLIEASANDTPLPRIEFDSKVVLPAPVLDKVLGDVQVMSDYITISVSKSSVAFTGTGDSGEAAVDMMPDDTIEVETDQASEGTYSLEYLLPVVRAVGSASDTITCEFSTAKPLRVGFTISGMGYIHFYLAPRVES